MDALKLPRVALPKVTFSTVRLYSGDRRPKRWHFYMMNPQYIVINAAWDVRTGIVTRGWRDGDIVVFPIPQGAKKVRVYRNGKPNSEISTLDYIEEDPSVDYPIRFYDSDPFKNPSLGGVRPLVYPYTEVDLRGNERYLTYYSRIKWQQYDYNHNSATCVEVLI